MALVFFDGFDFYNGVNGLGGGKWDQGSNMYISAGRWGGQALQSEGSGSGSYAWEGAFKGSPPYHTYAVGCAVYFYTFNGPNESIEHPFLWFASNFTPQASLWINPVTNHLELRQGRGLTLGSNGGTNLNGAINGTQLTVTPASTAGYTTSGFNIQIDSEIMTVAGTSSGVWTVTRGVNGTTAAPHLNNALITVLPVIIADTEFVPPLGLWWWLEFKVNISGAYEIRVNGLDVAAGSGALDPFGAGSFDQLHIASLGAYGPSVLVDDLYILDDQGSYGNDFLGEVRVQTQYPSAPGYLTQFVPATGTDHIAMLTNIPWPIDSFIETGKHNSGQHVGDIDSYQISPFAVNGGQIYGVQTNLFVRKDDVGTRTVKATLHTHDGSLSMGGAYGLYSSYTYLGNIWEIDPSTNAPWTLADLNFAEFGVKVQS